MSRIWKLAFSRGGLGLDRRNYSRHHEGDFGCTRGEKPPWWWWWDLIRYREDRRLLLLRDGGDGGGLLGGGGGGDEEGVHGESGRRGLVDT